VKTRIASNQEVDEARQWYVVDAEGLVLGRLASRIAGMLRGKHKATFAPHQDVGDYIIVVNAEKVILTKNKDQQKTYFRHTGYPGGGRITTYKQMLAKHPERVIEKAVKGMLPKNALGRKMYKKMKVYTGGEHPHSAQQPVKLEMN
jgi:large subunit ribosomal protein L13